jgi:hypothetical protein
MSLDTSQELVLRVNGLMCDASAQSSYDVLEDLEGRRYPLITLQGIGTHVQIFETFPGEAFVEITPWNSVESLQVPITPDNSVTLRTQKLGILVTMYDQHILTINDRNDPIGLPEGILGYVNSCLEQAFMERTDTHNQRLFPLVCPLLLEGCVPENNDDLTGY